VLTLGVAGDGPLSLLDHVLDSLGNLGASLGDVVELKKQTHTRNRDQLNWTGYRTLS